MSEITQIVIVKRYKPPECTRFSIMAPRPSFPVALASRINYHLPSSHCVYAATLQLARLPFSRGIPAASTVLYWAVLCCTVMPSIPPLPQSVSIHICKCNATTQIKRHVATPCTAYRTHHTVRIPFMSVTNRMMHPSTAIPLV